MARCNDEIVGPPRAPCINKSLLFEVKLCIWITLVAGDEVAKFTSFVGLFMVTRHMPVLLHLDAFKIGS